MIFAPRVFLRLVIIFGLSWMLIACQTFHSVDQSDLSEPYVILVSIDGLGAGSYKSVHTPTFDLIEADGVHASGMEPVFPSMTFPNHYSIATGLYPFEHGIVDNTFPDAERKNWYAIRNREAVSDGRWYSGEPIWVTAEKQGLTSAAFFFVGTEADVSGIRPTYWRPFDGSIPGSDRVSQVLEWLALPESERPRLVTMYFEDVDKAAHAYGPGSQPWQDAIKRVDGYLQQLINGLENTAIADNVSIVVVSDHGQSLRREDSVPFVMQDYVSLDGFKEIEHGSYVSLFMDSYDATVANELVDTINQQWQQGRAYTKDNAPLHWHVKDDPRFADVIVMAEPGHIVITGRNSEYRINKGNHGYDPTADAMQATFLARGPRLPAGKKLGQIHAVDVYPLLVELLQLSLPKDYQIQHDDLRELLNY